MPAGEKESLLDYPAGGLDESRAYVRQRKYGGDDGEIYTSPDELNVRGFDKLDRRRGGSRPGFGRYLHDPINHPTGMDPYSIQDLNILILGNANPTGTFGPFVFSAGGGNGFGLGSTAGASYYTAGVGTFYCSCWDKNGFAYITERESGKDFDRTNVYRVDSSGSGTGIWSSQQENFAVVGMVVIGDWLYFASEGVNPNESQIFKFAVADGKPFPSEGLFADPWLTTAMNANLIFSTGGVNVLAAVDRFLGVICCGDGAGVTDNFVVIDTESPTPEIFFSSTGTQGTSTPATQCKADTDGKFFYASLCAGNSKVQQIRPDGSIIWTFTASGPNNSIAYDRVAHRLFVLNRDSGGIQIVNASTGEELGSVSPNGSSIWRDLDCDGSGNVILWANNQAGGDIYAVNKRAATIWGPNTFAEADHTGASSFRADRASAPYGRNRLLALAGGGLWRFNRQERVPVITHQRLDSVTERVFSRQNGSHMYYADGHAYARYNGFTDTFELWEPLVAAGDGVLNGDGQMPRDRSGHGARLIETWRGRTVLSGLRDDPQNWFMSRIDNPLDWEYGPDFPSADQPVAGNNAYRGLVGDKVNSLLRLNDDVLVFGCDHTIWKMSSDPADGGQLDLVSDGIGFAWGRPYTREPDGTVYFFGSRGQVYQWRPGGFPVWISQQVQNRLKSYDVGEDTVSISMEWSESEKGLYLFITPYDFTEEDVIHWFWDSRVGAWHPFTMAHKKMNPKCTLQVDGDLPDDRVVAIGAWDSHVRSVEELTTARDDGFPFRSHVTLGPFLTTGLGEVKLLELQPTFADGSDPVDYEVMGARTAQGALFSVPLVAETFTEGRNNTASIGRAANALYLRLRSEGVWALEAIRALMVDTGKIRRRG